ncbi:hypothetical protein B0H14DRAFT_471254 [Mycena olivaceomarginata]|nr:hypothetical protein B0H14DRAFT_471254 [Mycena olivaceomarginata]
MDDDDDFLYGGGVPQPQSTPVPVTPSTSLGNFPSSEQIVAQLEAQAALAEASTSQATDFPTAQEDDDGEEAVELGTETEDDEDDVEIIMEPQSRSLDFRQSAGSRSAPPRTTSSAAAAPLRPQPSLTTEYTPIQRAGAAPPPRATPQAQPTPQPAPQAPTEAEQPPPATTTAPQTDPPPQSSPEAAAAAAAPAPAPAPADDGVDPSTLPAVSAPPSHPAIDPGVTGTLEGRPIIEVDLSSMTDKQWRKPGSDISDWFNYGFDELSWEAYCYRRRDLGELANVLKTSVLNFSGMPEDQLTALPPEVRQMVMTGTNAMLNGAGNPALMGQGMMMDMSGMMPMGMGVGVGMGGEMGMNGAMMQVDGRAHAMMGMQDGGQGQVGSGAGGGNGTPEGGMQEGGFVGGPGMMGMGMEYGVQEQNQMAQQQMYPQMEAPQPSAPAGLGRGAGAVPYRARGLRGARGFPSRGRGRGGYDAPPPPVRPTSPLPPNVPTGPRNQNKYKDRDGNAPAVDGLDYGGTKDGRTNSGEPEERSRSKRRISPGLDDVRGSKRR